MTGIAILILLRMTNLTLKIISMLIMIIIVLRPDVMTIAAGGSILDFIAMFVQIAITVHFSASVALLAVHRVRYVMNVRAISFVRSRIFISDAAAVASCTLIFQIRRTFDSMALNESSAYSVRATDMARAARRVAFIAFVVVFFVNIRM